ncbi:phage tail protein, partial [Salmonella enterica subsp. enterica serovar Typhimurium]|nr:phage tail protein [Salmonella enterica subsp. enterica serovar Typhimurium]
MATTPTNLPVPSESPRDLKFNAGKIDEFVTSKNHAYVDRFGDRHRTITGINYDANQAILGYGYITKKSFEIGATVDNINTALQWESNGEFYRWDGALPKVVPADSTPNSTGGIGEGKWVSVGDASLRTELSRGQYREDA